jgi:hypothetical protein
VQVAATTAHPSIAATVSQDASAAGPSVPTPSTPSSSRSTHGHVCDVCGHSFVLRTTLLRHTANEHGGKAGSPGPIQLVQAAPSEPAPLPPVVDAFAVVPQAALPPRDPLPPSPLSPTPPSFASSLPPTQPAVIEYDVTLVKTSQAFGLTLMDMPADMPGPRLYVRVVKSNTPASASGLQLYDQVLAIDGEDTTHSTIPATIQMLKSCPINGSVVMRVRRDPMVQELLAAANATSTVPVMAKPSLEAEHAVIKPAADLPRGRSAWSEEAVDAAAGPAKPEPLLAHSVSGLRPISFLQAPAEPPPQPDEDEQTNALLSPVALSHLPEAASPAGEEAFAFTKSLAQLQPQSGIAAGAVQPALPAAMAAATRVAAFNSRAPTADWRMDVSAVMPGRFDGFIKVSTVTLDGDVQSCKLRVVHTASVADVLDMAVENFDFLSGYVAGSAMCDLFVMPDVSASHQHQRQHPQLLGRSERPLELMLTWPVALVADLERQPTSPEMMSGFVLQVRQGTPLYGVIDELREYVCVFVFLKPRFAAS